MDQVLLYKYVGQLQVRLNLFQINRMSGTMKKSIKKSIKPSRTLQSKTRKKKTIYQLLNEIYQSLDEAKKIYLEYSTNPKKVFV